MRLWSKVYRKYPKEPHKEPHQNLTPFWCALTHFVLLFTSKPKGRHAWDGYMANKSYGMYAVPLSNIVTPLAATNPCLSAISSSQRLQPPKSAKALTDTHIDFICHTLIPPQCLTLQNLIGDQPTQDGLEKLKVDQLKSLLRKKGLPVSGCKAELIERLRNGSDGGPKPKAWQHSDAKKDLKRALLDPKSPIHKMSIEEIRCSDSRYKQYPKFEIYCKPKGACG